jgi:hypothetical protein
MFALRRINWPVNRECLSIFLISRKKAYQRIDLVIRHVAGMRIHHVVHAGVHGKILQLLAQISCALAGKTRYRSSTFRVRAMATLAGANIGSIAKAVKMLTLCRKRAAAVRPNRRLS